MKIPVLERAVRVRHSRVRIGKPGGRKGRVKRLGRSPGLNDRDSLRREEDRKRSREVSDFITPGKGASEAQSTRTDTDTGRQGEYPETDGRSVVKELGKKTP